MSELRLSLLSLLSLLGLFSLFGKRNQLPTGSISKRKHTLVNQIHSTQISIKWTQGPGLKIIPKGLPANIDIDKYPNLNAFHFGSLQKFASQPAFYCMGKSLTYGEVDKMSYATWVPISSPGD